MLKTMEEKPVGIIFMYVVGVEVLQITKGEDHGVP